MQRILIIEDDTTIRNGIQLYLQKKEFAVDCADTIAAANTLLAKMVYHLILLDIRCQTATVWNFAANCEKLVPRPLSS